MLHENKNSAEVDIAPASGKIHITMQGFTLTAITDADKTKFRLSQWTLKYRSRSVGQCACLKGMSRTITMQGFTLTAITDTEKTELRRKN